MDTRLGREFWLALLDSKEFLRLWRFIHVFQFYSYLTISTVTAFKIERMSENAVVATIVYLAAQNLAFFGATLFATVYAARRIGIAAALSH